MSSAKRAKDRTTRRKFVKEVAAGAAGVAAAGSLVGWESAGAVNPKAVAELKSSTESYPQGRVYEMGEGKYARYLKQPDMPTGDFPPFAPRAVLDSEDSFGNVNFGFRYSYFTEPPFQFELPHEHDYDQFLCFLGTPENIRDFDAEVELSLGKEGDKYKIDRPTIVHIPAGLTHTPINYKRITKPTLLVNITLSPIYKKRA